MKSRGFTLIEMLLATALSALLIGALLMIAGRLSSDRARLAEQPISDHSGINALIEWDLKNAEQVETVGEDRIDLVGHNAIDPATLQPTFRAVAVSYELQPATHELIRRQRMLDDPAAVNDWRSTIASHVKAISCTDSGGTRTTIQLQLDDASIEVACQR